MILCKCTSPMSVVERFARTSNYFRKDILKCDACGTKKVIKVIKNTKRVK